MANDYMPQKKVMRRQKRNKLHNNSQERAVNIDVVAESVKLPFASFIDESMIKKERLKSRINTILDKDIAAAQKRYELTKHKFIDKFHARSMNRNSNLDISGSGRQMNQTQLSFREYEGVPQTFMATSEYQNARAGT